MQWLSMREMHCAYILSSISPSRAARVDMQLDEHMMDEDVDHTQIRTDDYEFTMQQNTICVCVSVVAACLLC